MSSRSPTLTPLQEQLLHTFDGVDGVFLSGGAALGHFYLGHRGTLDLDWFTQDRSLLSELHLRLLAFCDGCGLAVQREREYPGFQRVRITNAEGESTLVDLVHDPVFQAVAPSDKPLRDGVRIDSFTDIVANKLTAVLGRGETKDLVDLLFIERSGVDPLSALHTGSLKDGGLDPATLAWVLTQVSTDSSDLRMLAPLREQELIVFRDALVVRLQGDSFPTAE